MNGTTQRVIELLKTQVHVGLRFRTEEERKMKKANVKVGEVYAAKVSGKVVNVRITGESRFGGWEGLNRETGKKVRIKSAQRLRGKLTEDGRVETGAEGATKAAAETKKATPRKKRDTGEPGATGGKRASGLDAAAQVLKDAGEPLNTKTIVERALAKGLWKTGGKTPGATIYSAILREMKTKGADARFKKAERGKFTLAK
jgi:hypothetical protein